MVTKIYNLTLHLKYGDTDKNITNFRYLFTYEKYWNLTNFIIFKDGTKRDPIM